MNFDTSFKKEIEDKLKEKKSAASTIKMHLRNLEKLNDNMPLKNFNFLDDSEAILKHLGKYKENTIRNYLISICSILGLYKDKGKCKKLYPIYYKAMMDKNSSLKNSEKNNVKTESQTKNWISWQDVTDKIDELKTMVDKFKNSKEINETKYNTLLKYVVLSLYYYLPPRRNLEFQACNLILNQDVEDLPTDVNYLNISNDEFIFNKYKNVRTKGEQIIEIGDELQDVILIYMKFHPLLKGIKKIMNKKINVPFLVRYNGKKLTSVNAITFILNKIFGKNVGSSLLRHIYLSDKYSKVNEEQKKDAEQMAHSLDMQKDYIKN